jgi:hypothetical protein
VRNTQPRNHRGVLAIHLGCLEHDHEETQNARQHSSHKQYFTNDIHDASHQQIEAVCRTGMNRRVHTSCTVDGITSIRIP